MPFASVSARSGGVNRKVYPAEWIIDSWCEVFRLTIQRATRLELGGSLTSKPTWLITSGWSATPVFLYLSAAHIPRFPKYVAGQGNVRSDCTNNFRRWWPGKLFLSHWSSQMKYARFLSVGAA